jgi:hypothetical protein
MENTTPLQENNSSKLPIIDQLNLNNQSVIELKDAMHYHLNAAVKCHLAAIQKDNQIIGNEKLISSNNPL